jgi:hypothetical protein
VTDNLTGLVWTQDAGCGGKKNWSDSVNFCNLLIDGDCGLSDGSSIGDWRLPNARELHSLIDFGNQYPALPTGHPFTTAGGWGWTSTTPLNAPNVAMDVHIDGGPMWYEDKSNAVDLHPWCVRDGE